MKFELKKSETNAAVAVNANPDGAGFSAPIYCSSRQIYHIRIVCAEGTNQTAINALLSRKGRQYVSLWKYEGTNQG